MSKPKKTAKPHGDEYTRGWRDGYRAGYKAGERELQTTLRDLLGVYDLIQLHEEQRHD